MHWLALATTNLSTKLKVCNFTRYDDMKGYKNVKNVDGLG